MGLLRRRHQRGRRKASRSRSPVEVIALHSMSERDPGAPPPLLPRPRNRAARREPAPPAA
jgi:hypothetical protein